MNEDVYILRVRKYTFYEWRSIHIKSKEVSIHIKSEEVYILWFINYACYEWRTMYIVKMLFR